MQPGCFSRASHRRFLGRVALALALAVPVTSAQTTNPPPAPLIFHTGGLYSANSGNTDCNGITFAPYNPVPALWQFDLLNSDGTPSLRTQLTYEYQNTLATANPPQGYRAFYATDNADPAVDTNPTEVNDIPNTLAWFVSQGFALDYAFADIESNSAQDNWTNTLGLVNAVRSSPAGGSHTFIGNFTYFPGKILLATDYPFFSDYRFNDSQYPTLASNGMTGLNVAMPAAYQMQAYLFHATDPTWGASWWTNTGFSASDLVALQAYLTYNQKAAIGSDYHSPNERAGMFYAPLESVSLAKRNLPAGHQLIPFISAFQSQTSGVPPLNPGQAPTEADGIALLEHYRLRGIDGYYVFGGYLGYCTQGLTQTLNYSDGSTFTVVSEETYLADMQTTWAGMQWFFDLPTQVGAFAANVPLNLYTFKNTGGSYVDPNGMNGGIEWSAFQRGNRILAVVSNLGNGSQAATGSGAGIQGNWQSVFAAAGASLPASSPVIPAGNHLVLQYLVNPAQVGFASYALNSVLASSEGWYTSGGSFVVSSPSGTGDASGRVVAVEHKAATAVVANASTANPGGIGATANDRVSYSFDVYTGWTGRGSASFAPVVAVGGSVPVPSSQTGPTLSVVTGGGGNYWMLATGIASRTNWAATNLVPGRGTWYALQMVIDPATNLASVFATNLTAGEQTRTLLEWTPIGSPNATPVSAVAAGLVPGEQSPSLYDAFQIAGSAGAQFDQLSAQLYAYPASPASSFTPAGSLP